MLWKEKFSKLESVIIREADLDWGKGRGDRSGLSEKLHSSRDQKDVLGKEGSGKENLPGRKWHFQQGSVRSGEMKSHWAASPVA